MQKQQLTLIKHVLKPRDGPRYAGVPGGWGGGGLLKVAAELFCSQAGCRRGLCSEPLGKLGRKVRPLTVSVRGPGERTRAVEKSSTNSN